MHRDTVGSKYESSRQQGTATWCDYNPFAKRLFWMFFLPTCTVVYASIAVVLCLASIQEWSCSNILVPVLIGLAGSLTLGICLWTGYLNYRLRHHSVVIGRGLGYVSQVHIAILLTIPVMWAFMLFNEEVISPTDNTFLILAFFINLCAFIFFSAVVSRLRQMFHLFSGSSFQTLPKNLYRNTVLGIGLMFLLANIIKAVLIVCTDVNDTIHSIAPRIAEGVCLCLLFYYGYRSRNASSRFSDYDQITRLTALYSVVIISTMVWKMVQPQAFTARYILIWGMQALMLLDSYVSLNHFIRYKLDPQCSREVQFLPPEGSSARLNVSIAVAEIQKEPLQHSKAAV